MSEMVARLKLESGEFDSKIRRAAQGIQRLTEECHNAGSVLNVLEEENQNYIRSIGQMETVSKTARGSVAELTSAFMDMKHVYNQLSEEEKNGEVGRELNKQLGILKQRINEGNQELKDMQQELNGGLGGALDSIAGKFGMNIKQLTGWGAALGAGKVALEVAKDAFFSNEQQLDEWGRTVQTSQSLYEGFLNSLNTGDISGYLSNIDNIITAARDAYDAMDTLATFNAFTRGSRAGLRSNYSEALNEYKLNPTAANKKALDEANKALVDGLQQQADKIKDSYEKALNSLGVNRLLKGQQLQEFKNLFRAGKWDELESMKAGYSQGKLLNAGSQYWYGDRVYDGKIKDRFTDQWRVMSENEKKQFEFARVLSQVNDKQINAVQALDEQYRNTLDAINNQNRSYNRLAGNNNKPSPQPTRRTGGGTTTVDYAPDSIMAQQAEVSRLTKLWQSAGATVRDDYKSQLEEAQYLLDRMTGKEKFDPANMRELTDLRGTTAWAPSSLFTAGTVPVAPSEIKFSESLQKFMDYMEKQQVDDYKKRQSHDSWDDTKKVVSGLNQVAGGLQQMGIKLPEEVQQIIGVINGLMTVIDGVNTIIGVTQSANLTANTIALGALTQAIWTNTAFSFFPGMARGGVVRAAVGYEVPGNHFSGDMVPALLNSGETVLNRAQSGVLAAALEGAGTGNMSFELKASGENLIAVIDRTGKRKGMGELCWWKS